MTTNMGEDGSVLGDLGRVFLPRVLDTGGPHRAGCVVPLPDGLRAYCRQTEEGLTRSFVDSAFRRVCSLECEMRTRREKGSLAVW